MGKRQIMVTKRLFNRSPRNREILPTHEIKVAKPRSISSGYSWYKIAIPVFVTIGGIAFLKATGSSAGSYGFMIIFMVGTYTVTLIDFIQNRQKNKNREGLYRNYLSDLVADVESIASTQTRVRNDTNPGPQNCADIVMNLSHRLWERSPADDDFLCVRLGKGKERLVTPINLPAANPAEEPDPLLTEAEEQLKDLQEIPEIPTLLDIRTGRVTGIVGERKLVINTLMGLMSQIATHHSPDEVKIACLFPEAETTEWVWTRWLPHVWDEDFNERFVAAIKVDQSDLLEDLAEEIESRQAKRDNMKVDKQFEDSPAFVVVIGDRISENNAHYAKILEEGPSTNVFPVIARNRVTALPSNTNAIVELKEGEANLRYSSSGSSNAFTPDDCLSLQTLDEFSRSLASVHPQSSSSANHIPNMVTLVDVLGENDIEAIDIWARWNASRPEETLKVAVGKTNGGALFHIDLHEKGDGPHGLGAGETRAGKTGLLKTLIASLCANFHPDYLQILIIDYKGGDLARPFIDLPHVTGVVTNLKDDIPKRALAALNSESTRRQMLFEKESISSIDEYIKAHRRGRFKTSLSHLIIIVDEFKELHDKDPQYMQELTRISTVGGSLGIHLISTTQKPAGIISEQIWSNAGFRFSLKVARDQDSREVLKNNLAAHIPKRRKGRAYMQVGYEDFKEFQSAWSDAPYAFNNERQDEADQVSKVGIRGSRIKLIEIPENEAGPRQLEVLCAKILETAEEHKVGPYPDLWIPKLPEKISLADLRKERGWDGEKWMPAYPRQIHPVVGLEDLPSIQQQIRLEIDFDENPNLGVYGEAQTGKTSFLQTLVFSLALDHPPSDVSLYIVDFDSQRLSMFESLPHVGGVIHPTEADRDKLNRLFAYLDYELKNRKSLFANTGVSNLRKFNASQDEPLADIFLLIDNLPSFIASHPRAGEKIEEYARENSSRGIHVVFTAADPSILRERITSIFSRNIALRLSEPFSYRTAVGKIANIEELNLVAGRGFITGSPPAQVHLALPNEDELDAGLLNKKYAEMLEWDGGQPFPILETPAVIPLLDLLPKVAMELPTIEGTSSFKGLPIGRDFVSLEPFSLNLIDNPTILITGEPRSGKSALLRTILIALAKQYSPDALDLVLVDYFQSELLNLQDLPQATLVSSQDDFGKTFDRLEKQIEKRRKEALQRGKGRDQKPYSPVVIAIDEFEIHDSKLNADEQNRILEVLEMGRRHNVHCVVAVPIDMISRAITSPLLKYVTRFPAGFLMGSSMSSHLRSFNISVTKEGDERFSAGEGYYINRGEFQKIKGAWVEVVDQKDENSLDSWIKRIHAGYQI